MTPSEARELSDKFTPDLSNLYKEIDKAARQGRWCIFINLLDKEADALAAKGYAVTQMGDVVYRVSWL